MQEIGVAETRAHVTALNERLIAGVDDLGGTVVTPRDPEKRGALVCIASTDAPGLVAELEKDGIVTSDRDGNLRVYDLVERLFPADLLATRVPEQEQRLHRMLSRYQGGGLLGTSGQQELWVGTYRHAGEKAELRAELVAQGALVPVAVEGLKGERYVVASDLPLVAQAPGLRATRVWRVAEALGGDTDLALACAMDFDDRAALDDGLRSDPMRAGGKILREIAPGLATFLVVVARSVRPFMPDLAPLAERLRIVTALADPVPAGHAAFAALDAITSRTTAAFSLFEQRAGVWLATVLIIAILVWSVR